MRRCLAAALLTWAAGSSLAQEKPEVRAEERPPAGLMTGAYGQALLQQAARSAENGASPGDAVNRFLQDRGLIQQGGGSSNLLEQMRDRSSEMVLSAMNFLGVPYKRGGNSAESGFDCSGFTRHIFEMSVGLVLPRRADEQAKLSSLVPIKKQDLKPGDLVFFNTMRRTFSHVGIYVGEGKFIHAPRSGAAVRVEDMREAYWAKRFTGARRADLGSVPQP